MDLTPDERRFRDYYLVSRPVVSRAMFWFQCVFIGVSTASFIYGFTKKESGEEFLAVGYTLALVLAVRSLYSGFTYAPIMRGLIQKYDAALKIAEKKEPNQTPEPTAPSGRGSS